MKKILPTSDLYLTAKEVDERFKVDVANSIAAEGMIHPLVVYSTTAKEWRGGYWSDTQAFHQCPEHLKDSEEVLLIMCGNNRYRALTEVLGHNTVYVHIVYSLQEASRLCKEQRESWNKRQHGHSETRVDKQSQCKTCQT